MYLCVMTRNLMATTKCWQLQNIEIHIKITERKEKKRRKGTLEYQRKGWPKVTRVKIVEIKNIKEGNLT